MSYYPDHFIERKGFMTNSAASYHGETEIQLALLLTTSHGSHGSALTRDHKIFLHLRTVNWAQERKPQKIWLVTPHTQNSAFLGGFCYKTPHIHPDYVTGRTLTFYTKHRN